MFAMGSAILLREDLDGTPLLRIAKAPKNVGTHPLICPFRYKDAVRFLI